MLLKLKNVRLSFPKLFKPEAVSAGDTPKHGAVLLLSKEDSQCSVIGKTIQSVAKDKWADKAPAILKSLEAGGKTCYNDGDKKVEYDGFDGCNYVSANNAARPLVIDRDRTPLTESDGRPYAGCYVNASLDVWAQDNNYGKRINATLRGVQFVKDGEAFTGSAPATVDEFDDLGDIPEGEDLGF
jgi:hypothetical protein